VRKYLTSHYYPIDKNRQQSTSHFPTPRGGELRNAATVPGTGTGNTTVNESSFSYTIYDPKSEFWYQNRNSQVEIKFGVEIQIS
jgi:hypothetical protein